MSVYFTPQVPKNNLQVELKQNAQKISNNIVKDIADIANTDLNCLLKSSISVAESIKVNMQHICESIQQLGIKDIKVVNDNIYIQTKKGNTARLKPPVKLHEEAARIFVLGELESSQNFYGISAFLNMSDAFRRFDIIKKGLRLNSNELLYASREKKQEMAEKMSEKLNKHISPRDIFYTSNEFYYPDVHNKIVYGARNRKGALNDNDISTCKFMTDSDSNIIGYEQTTYDVLKEGLVTKTYKEQQAPTYVLPDIVEKENPSAFAQACRFGNCKLTDRYSEALLNIKNKLNTIGVKDINTDKLQGIKFTDGDKKGMYIGYYSPNNGRSIIFDREGKFVCQLGYLKNEDGEIIDISEKL